MSDTAKKNGGKEKKNNPLVSVIVPVYNYEEYVRECIQSLVLQTYRNLEIIIIDDGSTDKSGQIVDEFAKEDERIKVFHKENGGIGSAIKVGLEHITGKYVAFLDSDDYMELSAYEHLVSVAEDAKADIVIFGLCMIGLNGEVRGRSISRNMILDGNQDIVRDYVLNDTITPLSRKFTRSSLFRNLEMLNYSVGIDETISIQLVAKCNRLVKIEECYYFAHGEPEKDSVSRRAIDGRFIETQIQMHREIIQYFSKCEVPYRNYYILRYLRFLTGSYVVVYKLQRNKEILNNIYKEFLCFWRMLSDTQELKTSNLKTKIQLYIFKISPQLYAWLRGMGFRRR